MRRLCARCLVLFPLVALAWGCGRKTPAPVEISVTPPEAQVPGEIQLSDARVTLLEPTVVQFEVAYRFTQGRPDKYYSCDVSFPGTPNHGVKMMEHWELKMEGVIRDSVMLKQPGAKSFEIYLSESPSPRERYKKISNVASGPVQ
jgi:hypothetical protein